MDVGVDGFRSVGGYPGVQPVGAKVRAPSGPRSSPGLSGLAGRPSSRAILWLLGFGDDDTVDLDQVEDAVTWSQKALLEFLRAHVRQQREAVCGKELAETWRVEAGLPVQVASPPGVLSAVDDAFWYVGEGKPASGGQCPGVGDDALDRGFRQVLADCLTDQQGADVGSNPLSASTSATRCVARSAGT